MMGNGFYRKVLFSQAFTCLSSGTLVTCRLRLKLDPLLLSLALFFYFCLICFFALFLLPSFSCLLIRCLVWFCLVWRRQAAQEEERRLVARVVHLMRNEDTDCYFRMLVVARRHLGQVCATYLFCVCWCPFFFFVFWFARLVGSAKTVCPYC